ncbi:MAG: iron-sulfur cluster assembly protein [Candidatus Midichloriaceae bacterium]
MELKDFIKQGSDSIFRDFTEEELNNIRKINGIKDKVIAILKLIYDPEISVNIWDLGLIYNIDISKENSININMTLTSPTCPVADAIPQEVKKKIEQIITDASNVNVKLVWEPKWDKSMMSEEAKFILDMM